MRDLNEDEMSAVAGGQGHSAVAETPVRFKAKQNTRYSSLTMPGTGTLDEYEGDGGGGDGGGGDGGGGDGGGGDGGGGDGGGDGGSDTGDTGDTGGDNTGDTGGDDGHGNTAGDTSAPVNDAENDAQLAKAEANPKTDISLTCSTQNGSKTCVSGNADHFIVTIEKGGSVTSYACSLNAGYSVGFSLDLFKSIRGGSLNGNFTSAPSFTCAALPGRG